MTDTIDYLSTQSERSDERYTYFCITSTRETLPTNLLENVESYEQAEISGMFHIVFKCKRAYRHKQIEEQISRCCTDDNC